MGPLISSWQYDFIISQQGLVIALSVSVEGIPLVAK